MVALAARAPAADDARERRHSYAARSGPNGDAGDLPIFDDGILAEDARDPDIERDMVSMMMMQGLLPGGGHPHLF